MAPKKKKVINHPAPNAHFPFNISKRKDESFQVPPGKRAKDNSRKYLVIPDSENSSLTEKSNPSSTESGDSSPAAVDDSSSAENSYTPSAKSDNNDDEYNRQIDTPSSSFTTFQSDNDEPDSEFNTGSAIMVEFESNIIIDSDSESDTGSVIIVDSTPLVKSRVDAQHHKRTSMSYTGSVVNIEARPTLPVSVETELNTQNRNLDELIHKIPPEVRFCSPLTPSIKIFGQAHHSAGAYPTIHSSEGTDRRYSYLASSVLLTITQARGDWKCSLVDPYANQ